MHSDEPDHGHSHEHDMHEHDDHATRDHGEREMHAGHGEHDQGEHVVHDHAEHEMHTDHGEHVMHVHAEHEMHAAHGEHDQDDHLVHEHAEHEMHTDHGEQEHAGHVDHTGHEDMFRRKFWVSLLLSIPVLAYSPFIQDRLGFQAPAFPGSEWVTPIFATVVFLYGGLPFLRMARPELRARRPGMMMLISLAISVAFVYSLAALFVVRGDTFFWELVTLIDVMLLGHWLEMRSVRQASGALDELAKLLPDTAERIESDGSTREVPVSELKTGDLILVRPGAGVPADGQIEQGESDVNEAMITGESKPVSKQPSGSVIGGSINGDGSLRVRVAATGDETALAGIMRLVEQAQQSKSDTQILADKAAGWLFYIAIGVAGLTAIGWVIAVGFQVDVIARVATVLVIACPHALGLAIPLVVAITTAMGANNGILVRDRLALELARDIDTVIFDKTGTLTKGEFGVVDLATVDGWGEEHALGLAAAIEADSEHTIARGLRLTAQARGVTPPAVKDFEAIKGRGVRAKWDGATVYVGGPRLLEMLEIQPPPELAQFHTQANARGQSVVHLVHGTELAASFALADVVRDESRQAVDRLHEMGVEVAMLTGDSQAVARAVADDLGIDQYFAEVLPEHKDQRVSELQAQGKKVAMVGDGVNDAPALTRADVGIAIGSGTDVAIESAGIILVKSNPLDVVKVFALSRASYRKMVQNLFWATGYNVIALPLAAGVLAPIGIVLSPAVGALFMSLSTVLVAINAQLLRSEKI